MYVCVCVRQSLSVCLPYSKVFCTGTRMCLLGQLPLSESRLAISHTCTKLSHSTKGREKMAVSVFVCLPANVYTTYKYLACIGI